MAGRLKRGNGSSVEESFNTPQKIRKTEIVSNLESENNGDEKVKALFDEFIAVFLKELFGVTCFRPLPPVIGVGQEVDLFVLHIVVRKRGGYNGVSKNGLWSLVAADCGFDSTFGSALKLVYVKYLDTLDRWLKKIPKEEIAENIGVKEEKNGFKGPFMELESDLKVFLSDEVKKEESVGSKNSALGSRKEGLDVLDSKVDVKSADDKSSNENRGGNVKVDEKQCVDTGGYVDDEQKSNEDSVSRKRKRECYLRMLKWIREVAKDPCDHAIEPLPERLKWKCSGTELQWKQILVAREAMLLKKNVDASPQQSVWQKKQKMHPSMYDDDQCNSERLRCSQRLLFAKDSSRKPRERLYQESSSSGFQSDDDNMADKLSNSTANSPDFCGNRRREKRVPIGQNSQVDLPEFRKDDYTSDSKWLGTRIWPVDKTEHRNSVIERDPIGKGRQELCGCQFPGSLECVKFHIREKRAKLKLELGSAYYKWKFDGMGELVALSWTKEEESKFQEIVETKKYFWDEIFKYFPKKGREALVSYYFNVFLLRRRGGQNRSGTSDIDSDAEDSELGPIGNRFGQIAAKSPVSIFCSPKKPHSNIG